VLDDIVRNMASGPPARLAQWFTSEDTDPGRWVLDGRLDVVAVPADLVWGDADEVMDMDYAERMMDGLPAARLATIKDCGHVPHRECPDRFLDVLEAALAQPPPEPAPEPEPAVEEEP
jgi:pimeloyl-ACP methyl ester carboxylesterase